MTDHLMHYDYNGTDPIYGYKIACGLGFTPDLYVSQHIKMNFTCLKCLESEVYKNDLIAFEIGFERNEHNWFIHKNKQVKEEYDKENIATTTKKF